MRLLSRPVLLALFAILVLVFCGTALAQDQYRAFWVDAYNTPLNNLSDVQAVMSKARAAKANALFVQIRRRGDSWFSIGTESTPDTDTLVHIEPNFDPLDALITEAHANGLELHAYVIAAAIYDHNPIVIGLPGDTRHVFITNAWDSATKAIRSDSQNWITRTTLPDTTGSEIRFSGYRFGNDFWVDFGHPDAAAHTVNVILGLVRNYPALDGIHLDRIRYPEISVSGQTPSSGVAIGYNSTNVARFNAKYGLPAENIPDRRDARWQQWRRDQVTNLVRRVYLGANALNPRIKISASTIVYGNAPSSWIGAEAYWRVFQDWRAWLEEGILDINVPMNYKTEAATGSSALDNWNEFFRNNDYGRFTLGGMGSYLNFVECSMRQIRRTLAPSAVTGKQLPGISFYSMANTSYKNSSATATVKDPCSIPPNENYGPGRQLPFAEFAAALTTGRSADGAKPYEDQTLYPTPIFAYEANVPTMSWKVAPTVGHLKGFIRDENGQVVDAGDITIARVDDGTNPTGRTVVNNATDGGGFYGGVGLVPGAYKVTVTPTGTAPHTMQCTATVNVGEVTNFDFTIDRNVPTSTFDVTPKSLWPPDHKMVFVTLSGVASDIGTGLDSITFKVTDEYGLVQPEMAAIDAAGQESLDWNVSIPLEASRLGDDKDGRVYTIEITVKDRACNVKTFTTEVTVAHDQGNS